MRYKLGCFRAVSLKLSSEYVAEWFISWIPFYYLLKTLFLLFLSLPQTQGSTFIYTVHLSPFLRTHELEIDSALTQFKLAIYNFAQDKLKALWQQFVGTSLSSQGAETVPSVGAINPPSRSDPISGAVQWAAGWWNAYAPAVIATGAAYIASRQQAAENAAQRHRRKSLAQTQRPESYLPSASSSLYPPQTSDTASVIARRRALEAELAALPPTSPVPETPIDSLGGLSEDARTSSSSSFLTGDGIRKRRESGSEDEGRYERVSREELEGEERPGNDNRGGWWWGGKGAGYERVKNE